MAALTIMAMFAFVILTPLAGIFSGSGGRDVARDTDEVRQSHGIADRFSAAATR